MAHIRAFFNLVDLALSDTEKESYDVAGVFKQASGGVLMWALVIRSGQDLTLQANDYCIPNSVYGGSNPPFSRGKLCPVKPCRWSHMGFRPLPCRTPTASGCAEGADRQRWNPKSEIFGKFSHRRSCEIFDKRIPGKSCLIFTL